MNLLPKITKNTTKFKSPLKKPNLNHIFISNNLIKYLHMSRMFLAFLRYFKDNNIYESTNNTDISTHELLLP